MAVYFYLFAIMATLKTNDLQYFNYKQKYSALHRFSLEQAQKEQKYRAKIL